MERRVAIWNGEGPEGTERLEKERIIGVLLCRNWHPHHFKPHPKFYLGCTSGPDGTERDQIERRQTRLNGERPDGTERDQMERRGIRRNGEGLGRNEEGLDGRERSHLSRTEKNYLPSPSCPSLSYPVPLHTVPSLSSTFRPSPCRPVPLQPV